MMLRWSCSIILFFDAREPHGEPAAHRKTPWFLEASPASWRCFFLCPELPSLRALDTSLTLQRWVACRQASTPAAAIINVGLHLWHLRMSLATNDTRLQKWDSTNIRGSHVNTQCLFEDHHLVISMLIVHTRSTWQRRHSLRLTLLQQL